MRDPSELLGVWRLLAVTRAGRPVSTRQTHLVIEPSRLWEVWPARVVHDDDEGPERAYEVRPRGGLWEIDIMERRRPRLALAALGHDGLLSLRLGDDERPVSIDDDSRGASGPTYASRTKRRDCVSSRPCRASRA